MSTADRQKTRATKKITEGEQAVLCVRGRHRMMFILKHVKAVVTAGNQNREILITKDRAGINAWGSMGRHVVIRAEVRAAWVRNMVSSFMGPAWWSEFQLRHRGGQRSLWRMRKEVLEKQKQSRGES